jgi:hypothetical protein
MKQRLLQKLYTPQLSQAWNRMRRPFTARDIEPIMPAPHQWIDALYQEKYLAFNGSSYCPSTRFGLLPIVISPMWGVCDPNMGGKIHLWQLGLWGELRVAKGRTLADLESLASFSLVRNYLGLLEQHGWVRAEKQGRAVLWVPRRSDPIPPFAASPVESAKRLFDPRDGEFLEVKQYASPIN